MDAFVELRDPQCRQRRYPLDEIVLPALCAVRCGVEDWETMALWGRTQLGWLRKHLAYANGIPCEDTFRRVFNGLSPVAFERCVIEWVGNLCPSLAGLHLATEGKTVRGNAGRSGHPLHLSLGGGVLIKA
ncbi:MAG: ISAs1 family transposase [Burkholderia sp.]